MEEWILGKHYIVINLNKAESAETRQARVREQVRWGIFGVLIMLLLSVNIRVWMISYGYDGIIDKKAKEISTFDFSTLYTKLPHGDLIRVLHQMVDFAFNGGKFKKTGNRKFLTVHKNYSYWTKETLLLLVKSSSSYHTSLSSAISSLVILFFDRK